VWYRHGLRLSGGQSRYFRMFGRSKFSPMPIAGRRGLQTLAGIIKFGTRHDHRILFLTAGHESHVVGAPSEAYVKTIVQVSRRLIPACEIRELWRTLAALRESARAYSKTRSANGFRGFSAANYCGRGTRRVHDIADATNLLIFMRKGW
jgi:hypothetical protein